MQEDAERHRCPSDLDGCRQENNKRIYIHSHPQGIIYRVSITKLRQNLRKKEDIKIEGKKLSRNVR